AEAARLIGLGPLAVQLVVGDRDGEVGRCATASSESRGAAFAVPILGGSASGNGPGMAPSAAGTGAETASSIGIAPGRMVAPGADRDASRIILSHVDEGFADGGGALERLLAQLRAPIDPSVPALAPILAAALRSEAAGADPMLARV